MKKKSLLIRILTGAVIPLALGYLAFSKDINKISLTLFPSDHQALHTFSHSDHTMGGQSKVHLFEALGQVIRFRYELNAGYAWPWAGAGVDFSDAKDNSSGHQDFSSYDSLYITLKSTASEELQVQLLTHNSGLTQQGVGDTYRHSVKKIPVDRSETTVGIELENMYIPDWWYDKHNINKSDKRHFYNKVWRLEISPTEKLPYGIVDQVEITRIHFTGYSTFMQKIFVFYVLGAILFFLGLPSKKLELKGNYE
jgi:hypothetical protein